MSASGVGRGRGWLNINKSQNANPGLTPQTNINTTNYEDDTQNTYKSSSIKNSGKYSTVLDKINLFDENDDGILLNQKLKLIVEEINNTCHSENEVQECFEVINDKCLSAQDFANKLIGIATTPSFSTLVVQNVKLRSLFLTQLQTNFENAKELQNNHPSQFRITVKMLGDYFHKTRFHDGMPIKIFSEPLIQYLNMLLDSNNEADLELFTSQLFVNGNNLKEHAGTQLTQTLLQVRKILSFNDKLTPRSRLWLLLALDISNNRFSFFVKDIHQFYVTQLGEDSLSYLQKLDHESAIHVACQNLTLDQNTTTSSNTLMKANQNNHKAMHNYKKNENRNNESHKQKFNQSQQSSKSSDSSNSNNYNNWENTPKEKTPRPILGVGARLKSPEDEKSDSGWTTSSSSGWGDNKKKDPKNWNKPENKKRNPKGWEHDDRLETDYN